MLTILCVHTLQNAPTTSFSFHIWLHEIYDYRTHKFFLRLETMVQHVLRNSRSYQVGLPDRRMKSTVLRELTSALLTSCVLQTAAGREQWLVINQGSRDSEFSERVGEQNWTKVIWFNSTATNYNRSSHRGMVRKESCSLCPFQMGQCGNTCLWVAVTVLVFPKILELFSKRFWFWLLWKYRNSSVLC